MKNIGYSFMISVICVLVAATGVCFGITAEGLKELIEQGEKVTVIDVRSNVAYTNSHIPSAINIPARLCGLKKFPSVGLVIVCGDGIDPDLTRKAVKSLQEKPGITAEILEGGFAGWEALNYLTTGEVGMKEENLPYITYQQLQKVSQSNPDLVLVDVRTDMGKQGRFLSDFLEPASANEVFTDLSSEFP